MIVDSKDMNWIGKVNFEGGKVYTSGKTIFFPNNIYFLTWKDIDERVKDYDYIVFTENEFFLNEELIPFLQKWTNENKLIYFLNLPSVIPA